MTTRTHTYVYKNIQINMKKVRAAFAQAGQEAAEKAQRGAGGPSAEEIARYVLRVIMYIYSCVCVYIG